jgi:uncharacterized YccA/Bax inhibitor family protein
MSVFSIPGVFGSPLLSYPVPQGLYQANEPSRASSAGALRRTAVLFAITACVMLVAWHSFLPAALANNMDVLRPLGETAFASGVVALSLVFVGRYRVEWLPVIAPLYTVFGGFFLAGVSLTAEARFPGIALNTLLATAAVFMLIAAGYALRWFTPTARFRAVVFSVTAGIGLVYLAAFGLTLVGVRIPFIHDGGWGGILWTGFICTVAAMHLLIDFAAIERLDREARSAYMEWYVALGLMVTLVWMYLFLLRLLQQVRR